MTALAERPAAPTVDATTPPARRRRPRWLAAFGVLLVVAVLGACTLILLSFGGNFTDYVNVMAEVPASSTAVALNSPVEYRNVQVGKVATTGSMTAGGMIELALHLNPSEVHSIPANVAATVQPVSIFGNEYVVLQPPAQPSTATVHAGSLIRALQTSRTASLQATLGSLDNLLIELHPQLLDDALTAVAGALQGQGYSIGQTLDNAHSYLGAMQPLWPQVVADLQTLVPVAGTIAAATPDLAGTLSNLEAPNQTVSSTGAGGIQALFANGATVSDQAAGLLQQIQQPFAVLAAASGPFLDDLSGAAPGVTSPMRIAQILSGLSQWASTWAAAEQSGPYINLSATVAVANPADLALSLLGGPLETQDLAAGLGPGYVNPPTYTSAANPVPAAALAAASTSQPLAEPAAEESISRLVQGATGSAPADPAVATLLVAPVLHGLVAGVAK